MPITKQSLQPRDLVISSSAALLVALKEVLGVADSDELKYILESHEQLRVKEAMDQLESDLRFVEVKSREELLAHDMEAAGDQGEQVQGDAPPSASVLADLKAAHELGCTCREFVGGALKIEEDCPVHNDNDPPACPSVNDQLKAKLQAEGVRRLAEEARLKKTSRK